MKLILFRVAFLFFLKSNEVLNRVQHEVVNLEFTVQIPAFAGMTKSTLWRDAESSSA
jgi:hypothetical protein